MNRRTALVRLMQGAGLIAVGDDVLEAFARLRYHRTIFASAELVRAVAPRPGWYRIEVLRERKVGLFLPKRYLDRGFNEPMRIVHDWVPTGDASPVPAFTVPRQLEGRYARIAMVKQDGGSSPFPGSYVDLGEMHEARKTAQGSGAALPNTTPASGTIEVAGVPGRQRVRAFTHIRVGDARNRDFDHRGRNGNE